ncbi:MAG TPA: anaerobic ribonucleoside-triphosphate reductase activating protein [Candidatus Cloacimonas sp.]|jgi:pyruvate formate lyase activating enzyme|nr:anaerobic ribonucleoside-triphosphate reductase activating protein [Candidatus Cloacimonas sp.]MDD2251148.1 anaerobic ribonucleoside-triphosphate reductase activating protein [Candidatus Cloacimonadota bacterium]MDD3870169.1 anaerobic ribonucleoside-triphosphate reductase activating protein [Candidatus Cloacimonadota bacterium]MDD4677390.1 anaerobic ribonucleoside-triphosphate reductase activating protein [Candidatus Cloacimonadota bacterium]HOG27539.1 anaerobic ribonucleoside-triphosphate r
MKIGGLQKFSLLDYPGELSAIIFTQGCNFRCPYCHNPELVDPVRYSPLLDTEWVLRFLYKRHKKLSAVVITGGEPTLQEDLIPFLKLIKAMRYKIKLDTNGSHPDVLQEIGNLGLVDYWAMDIKAPIKLYKVITRADLESGIIEKSMDIIRQSGIDYEFRTTYFDLLLTSSDLASMQELLKPGDRFIIQQCRYENTLQEITREELLTPALSFNENPACRSLINWGTEHSVKISLRSL